MKKFLSSVLISFVLIINLIIPVYVIAAAPTINFSSFEDNAQSSSNLRSWYFKVNTTGINDGSSVSFEIRQGRGVLDTVYRSTKITAGVGDYFTGYILEPATIYKVTAMSGNTTASFEKTTLGASINKAVVIDTKTPWWFTGIDGGVRGLPLGYSSVDLCNTSRYSYVSGFSSTTAKDVGVCFQNTIEYAKQMVAAKQAESDRFTNEVINKNEAINVNAKKEVGKNNSVYNFLAPIAGLNKMSSVSNDPTCTEKTGCISNNIGAYLNTIFKIGIGLCAALAVIMLIINGITYMGDESIFAKTEAKSKMFSAILGLLIALGAWALLNTINPALTGKGGLNISQAVVEIENESVPWSTYEVGDNKAGCPSGFVDVATNASPSKINVCNTIAKGVSDLIAAAKASNPSLVISGSGSRSTATTQALRVKNSCPDPTTPSTQCKPNAVARPGSSNHERGLAVDFNCNGAAMGKTDIKNVCYDWLTKNAMRFSLKNNFATLQETWHWSTDGK